MIYIGFQLNREQHINTKAKTNVKYKKTPFFTFILKIDACPVEIDAP
jgi:hypothetical protein